MEVEDEISQHEELPEFSWTKIDGDLFLHQTGQTVKVSLQPQIGLASFNDSDSRGEMLTLRVHINLEKALHYSQYIGWNWHKSSNLPTIDVSLEAEEKNTGNLLNIPSCIKARICAVKIVESEMFKDSPIYLSDVGLKGDYSISLKRGYGSFEGLNFLTTSYNNDNTKFNLLVIIYKEDNQTDLQNGIISSFISSQIFIDSRRTARDYREKKHKPFVSIFDPIEFTREFSKKEGRVYVNSPHVETVIENNNEGLLNYLTAPNIRNKVKHPLFLCGRFTKSLEFGFNSNHSLFKVSNFTAETVFIELQKSLIRDPIAENKGKKKIGEEIKPFYIKLLNYKANKESKRIISLLSYLEGSDLAIIADTFCNPEMVSFESVFGKLSLCYSEKYEFLKEAYKNLIEEKDEYSDEDSKKYSSEEKEPLSQPLRCEVRMIRIDKSQERSGQMLTLAELLYAQRLQEQLRPFCKTENRELLSNEAWLNFATRERSIIANQNEQININNVEEKEKDEVTVEKSKAEPEIVRGFQLHGRLNNESLKLLKCQTKNNENDLSKGLSWSTTLESKIP